ncbi:MAG: RNA polymerase sigma factor, partial [Mycobacteriales bacterium]
RDETWRALAGLGRRQRAVVVLRYYEDRTDHEIAALLGCSESTVRSQAARALAKLRQDWTGAGTAAPTASANGWAAP